MNYKERLRDPNHPARVLTYCPNCGKQKLVYQDYDAFICNDCDFTLFINNASAVACLIEDNDGRILFTRRNSEPYAGTLDLPGGFVDVMETAENAVKREIFEELNLDIIDITYITSQPNYYTYKELTYYTLDLAFKCTAVDLDPIKTSDELAEYIFLRQSEIKSKEIGFLSIRKIINHYIQYNS